MSDNHSYPVSCQLPKLLLNLRYKDQWNQWVWGTGRPETLEFRTSYLLSVSFRAAFRHSNFILESLFCLGVHWSSFLGNAHNHTLHTGHFLKRALFAPQRHRIILLSCQTMLKPMLREGEELVKRYPAINNETGLGLPYPTSFSSPPTTPTKKKKE